MLTGGLGPTKDDITKKTLVDYFDTTLELNEDVWERMKQIFESRGKDVLKINRSQAMIPKDCIMLPNMRGTAQGMWFERHGKVFVSMPGVPHEMKHLMENQVIPKLKEKFSFPKIIDFKDFLAITKYIINPINTKPNPHRDSKGLSFPTKYNVQRLSRIKITDPTKKIYLENGFKRPDIRLT